MTRRDIDKVIKHAQGFDVVVEIRRCGNRYWLRQGQAYLPITSLQFDRLLEGGYIDPDYRVEHLAVANADQFIYRGR